MGVLCTEAREGDEGIYRVALERDRDHAAQSALRVIGRDGCMRGPSGQLPEDAPPETSVHVFLHHRLDVGVVLAGDSHDSSVSALQRALEFVLRRRIKPHLCANQPVSRVRDAPMACTGRPRHLIYALNWTQCGGFTNECSPMRSGLSSQYQATRDRSYLMVGGGLFTCAQIRRGRSLGLY